jgi:hypothetical protein
MLDAKYERRPVNQRANFQKYCYKMGPKKDFKYFLENTVFGRRKILKTFLTIFYFNKVEQISQFLDFCCKTKRLDPDL